MSVSSSLEYRVPSSVGLDRYTIPGCTSCSWLSLAQCSATASRICPAVIFPCTPGSGRHLWPVASTAPVS